MLLLFKYYKNMDILETNKFVLYILFLLVILYFSKTLFCIYCITDIYLFSILNNFTFIKKQTKNNGESSVKMEIVAEGVTKKETDNLLNTLIEYSEKFNKKE